MEMEREEEMVISPRSARMLLNAIREGSGCPSEAAPPPPGEARGSGGGGSGFRQPAAVNNAQQHQRSTAGPNNSSCSAATKVESPMQCDGPRQQTSPQTPRSSQQVLTLQPFDDLLRREDDARHLEVFNSWMSNNAIDIGRPFTVAEPFTPKEPQHAQPGPPLTTC
jgi:hypothetical protein